MARAQLFQKDIPREERVFVYGSEDDDPIKTREQERGEEVRLPDGYEYIPKNVFVRMFSAVMFRIFWIFGQWYERWYWGVKVHGREKLEKARGRGYVIYANHTNPFHDVFGPAIAADRRIFTIISPVNLKIPGIGKLLPYIGGLPLGKTPQEKWNFNEAVEKRLAQKKAVVVYPEAHVWPYYTKIRKFPAGDRVFKYPVQGRVPAYAMVTTYHKRKRARGRRGELPRMDVWIEGPFWPSDTLSERENWAELARKTREAMKEFSKKNTYEYFEYRKKTGDTQPGNKKKGKK